MGHPESLPAGAPRKMLRLLTLILLLVTWPAAAWMPARLEEDVLLDVKAALDPHGEVLMSWQAGGRPCSGAFEGVLCDTAGRVTNISLQGRSLSGFIPDAVSELSALSGLFLHFNDLRGSIPASLSSLAALTDMYLNWNQLSGPIPPQLGQLSSLEVLELSNNKLDGEIPVELANISNLETLAVNANILNGTIPATIGNMTMLARLDVSNNSLTGKVPDTIANLPNLVFLDVSDNLLSGPVPTGLFSLREGFRYSNNSGLCGMVLDIVRCPATSSSSTPLTTSKPTKSSSKLKSIMSIATAIAFAIGGSAFLILVFICLGRRNAKLRSLVFKSSSDIRSVQKAGIKTTSETKGVDAESISESPKPLHGSFHGSPPDFSILGRSRVMSGRSTSAFASTGLPSAAEWSSWMSLDELETATNYFSEKNLLRKNCQTAVYKGTLRDGTTVAVKAIYNTRYSFGEQDFQIAIEALMQVKHENLVNFLGFCCSKGGSECFLVYAFVPGDTLDHHLHGQSEMFLNWRMRVNIIRGIAKGLAHLHEGLPEPLTMVHQNLWAGNVLLDKQGNALLADYGLSDIVAEEVMYATHKTLAALGSLAPEYAHLGQVTEDCDIYAFGALILEVVTGSRAVFVDPSTRTLVSTAAWVQPLLKEGRVREVVDPTLEGRVSVTGAAALAHIALQCMSHDPGARPNMVDLARRLHACEAEWSDMPRLPGSGSGTDSFLIAATAPSGRPASFSHDSDALHRHPCR
ncbi:hypothetical protein M758_4G269000 [Ceratodon purpureus]|nr:hypothetical protein M758_4G269000 [Ceratodon purpureus]